MTDGKCDSCDKIVDILIPIRMLCEARGGMEMQLKHYCSDCFIDVLGFVPQQEEKEEANGWVIAWWKNGKSHYVVQLLEKNTNKIFVEYSKDPKIRELIKAKVVIWNVKT